MKPINKTDAILSAMTTFLLAIIATLPIGAMEYLSINIVGEPPINGLTWMEGVDALGGELSMRLLAAWGVIIVAIATRALVRQQAPAIKPRAISNGELVTYFAVIAVFFVVNVMIGYGWWDPAGVLGMGPLFAPSMASLAILGFVPFVAKAKWHLQAGDFASSRAGFRGNVTLATAIAFGYGLVSCIWHCCSFYDPKMYFFFFVTKLVQLWAMCSFFFMWGFPMLFQRFKKGWLATLVTSLLFGLTYPWHTIGFAITFMGFGFLFCILTRKTGSYVVGLLLLYFAYIFHAGLPWHGEAATFLVIHPVSVTVLCCMVLASLIWNRRFLHRNDDR